MNPPRFAPRALLFDLDGTLLDTIADLAAAANLMLAELGQPPRSQEEIHSFVGKGIANLVHRCLTENRAPVSGAETEAALAAFHRHYTRVNGQNTRPYPGVPELLAALTARALKMAVVTNKATAFTLPLLEQFGIAPHLGAVVCGDTLPVRKPDPAVIEHACARLEVTPPETLVIGDSANDALAARAAGAPVLLVTYGYSEGAPVNAIACDGYLPDILRTLDCLA
ncbi:MAG: phosphoglycolate phosphatase [Azoarcus sp.]|nr:phosphoglycolate phosphatase [Azoarcus sp.]